MQPSGQAELTTGFDHPMPQIGVLTAKTYEQGGVRVIELWQHAVGYDPVLLARDQQRIRRKRWYVRKA